jgi:hypothetical protein
LKNVEDERSPELIEQHAQQEDHMVMRVYAALNSIDRIRYTLTDAREIVIRREDFRKALGL